VPPRLAIGVATMCHQLLRLKRGGKADLKFISGFPSFRPAFSAAALRKALGKSFAHFLTLLQEDGTILKLVVAFWLKSGFSVFSAISDLLTVGFSVSYLAAAGVKAKDVFIAAALSKIDVKVRLKLDAPYNFTEICKP
jgi:hypothetical protein